MSSSGQIRAGRAYVELAAEDGKMEQGLKSSQSKLKAWGEIIASLGSHLAASGIFRIAPILLATQAMGSAGEELVLLSQNTKATVEELSALGVVASRVGGSVSTIGSAADALNQFLTDTVRHGGEGIRTLAEMKINLQELTGAGLVDRLSMIADAIKRMPSPALQAEAATTLLGAAGRQLLPILRQGSGAINQITAEAHKMGLVISKEDAEAAQKFQWSLRDLWASVQRVITQFGAVFVPVLRGVVAAIQPVVQWVIEFIKNNDHLIQSKLLTAVADVAIGAALIVLGKSLIVASGLLTGLGIIFTGLASVAMLVVGVIGSALSAAFYVASTAIGILFFGLKLLLLPAFLVYVAYLAVATAVTWAFTSAVTAVAGAVYVMDSVTKIFTVTGWALGLTLKILTAWTWAFTAALHALEIAAHLAELILSIGHASAMLYNFWTWLNVQATAGMTAAQYACAIATGIFSAAQMAASTVIGVLTGHVTVSSVAMAIWNAIASSGASLAWLLVPAIIAVGVAYSSVLIGVVALMTAVPILAYLLLDMEKIWKALGTIGTYIAIQWKMAGAMIAQLWSDLKTQALIAWGVIKSIFGPSMRAIAAGVSNFWRESTSYLSSIWTGLATNATNIWTGIASGISGLWGSVVSSLAGTWEYLKRGFGDAWSGIMGAIKIGDWASAWEVLKAAVNAAWVGIVGTIKINWLRVKTYVLDTWDEIKFDLLSAMNTMWAAIATIWENATYGLGKILSELLAEVVDKVLETVSAISPAGAALAAVINSRRPNADDGGQAERAHQQRLDSIELDRIGRQTGIGGPAAGAGAQRHGELSAAEAASAKDLEDALDELTDALEDQREAAQGAAIDRWNAMTPEQRRAQQGGADTLQGVIRNQSTAGTFNAAQATAFGGGTGVDPVVNSISRTNTLLTNMYNVMRNSPGLVWGM